VLGESFGERLVMVSGALLAGGVAYVGACLVLRVEETKPLLRLLGLQRQS
jgi:hypothetical protein